MLLLETPKIESHKGDVRIGDISVERLAELYGTPLFIYDVDAVLARVERVRRAFTGDAPVRVLYAMKANPCVELLEHLARAVDGIDVSSLGELEMALAAGFWAEQLSFAGPAKGRAALSRAIDAGLGAISVESLSELALVAELSRAQPSPRRRTRVTLRLDPDATIAAFPVKMTGVPTPFGIEERALEDAVHLARANEDVLDLAGVHVYAGTQCLSAAALLRGMMSTLDLAERVDRALGRPLCTINLGGGFGVPRAGQVLDLDSLGKKAVRAFSRYASARRGNPVFVLELGRYLVAEHGLYVTRAISEKQSRGRRFIILDGGTNHLLPRSSHHHEMAREPRVLLNLSNPEGKPEEVTVVGPLCTPLDMLAERARLPSVRVGDLVGVPESGAYGLTASPLLFLGHKLPAELLIHNGALLRARPPRLH